MMTGASFALLFSLCLRSEKLQLYSLHLVFLPLVEVPLCTGTDRFIGSLVSVVLWAAQDQSMRPILRRDKIQEVQALVP